ncbi:hypothetical protein CMI37_11490 [Candidatus Pacearchaeota archaeon]|nr:hypothetical protein [Candidatus Pacearchaeota archaeon]|tara:strand:- start:4002 stop:4631 length:630 start_codon:yes stop_codon:yes gene_type:complete
MPENIFVINGKAGLPSHLRKLGKVSPSYIAKTLLLEEIRKRNNNENVRELDIGFKRSKQYAGMTKIAIPDSMTNWLLDPIAPTELIGDLDDIIGDVYEFLEGGEEDALLVTCHPFNKFENLIREKYGFSLIGENDDTIPKNMGHQLNLPTEEIATIGYPEILIEDRNVYATMPDTGKKIAVGKIRIHDDRKYDGYGIVGRCFEYFRRSE